MKLNLLEQREVHLFSVNNISGTPIIEVEDTNEVRMGDYLVQSGHNTAEATTGGSSGDYVLASVDTSVKNMVIFEYVIKDTSAGNNCRAGSVTATWDNSNNVVFNEVSTADLGTTADISLSVVINTAGEAELIGTKGSTPIAWNIKTIIRTI